MSEEEEDGVAGAVGVDAGVLDVDAAPVSLFDALESLEALVDLPESLLLSLDADDGFALPYPSAYQPPPLKATAGAWMTRSIGPPQWGH